MKKSLILISMLAIASAGVAAEQPLLARVTVYWASGGKGSDHLTRQHKAATGCRLRDGHCAVDPRHIPYGSKVVLADGSTLAAVDTGTAVINRKAARKSGRTASERNAIVIDRFFETKRQALNWAATHPAFMSVKVVRPNRAGAPVQVAAAPRASTTTSLTKANPITVQPLAVKTPLLAASTTVVRSPLNRLGR